MADRKFKFELKVNGDSKWSITHDIESTSKPNFYIIKNKSTTELTSVSLAEKMLLYRFDNLNDYPDILKNLLISSWKQEIIRRSSTHEIAHYLDEDGWDKSEDSLPKHALSVAEKSLEDFKLTIAVDLQEYSTEIPRHYLLHSMFPIGESHEVIKKGTESPLNFIGQFSLNSSRTSLNNEDGRNSAICGLVTHLFHDMLEKLSNHEFRNSIGLFDSVYKRILQFPAIKLKGDQEYYNLLTECINKLDKENTDIGFENLLDFDTDYMKELFNGQSYPTKNDDLNIQWSEMYSLRNEIKNLLNSESIDIVNWAQDFIHEQECCINFGDDLNPLDSLFISKLDLLESRTEVMPQIYNDDYEEKARMNKKIKLKLRNDFSNLFLDWKPDYLPKPKLPISSDIAKLLKKDFDKEWPYWLPIPVKQSGTRKDPVWKLPSKLINAVLFKNSINWQSDDTDDLVKQIYEYAQDKGIEVYELANLWEPLYAGLETIRGIDIIEGDINLVMQKSVDFVIDRAKKLDDKMLYNETQESRNNLETVVNDLRDILQEVGQTKVRWPFFMQNEEGNLLMISKPDSKWNNVLLCTNDLVKRKYNPNHDSIVDDLSPNKTLWWMDDHQKTSFVPLYEHSSDAPELYIKNLNKHSEKITHLIESRRNQSEVFESLLPHYG